MDAEQALAGARERLEQRAGHTGSIGPDRFSDEAVVTSSSRSKFLAELKPDPGSGVLKVLPPSAVTRRLCSRKRAGSAEPRREVPAGLDPAGQQSPWASLKTPLSPDGAVNPVHSTLSQHIGTPLQGGN